MKKSYWIRMIIFSTICLNLSGYTNAKNVTGDTPNVIIEAYRDAEAWGMLTSIDLSECDPDLIRSSNAIKEFVKQLCDLIEMKRYGETEVVHFGEDEKVAGYSMIQLIETSLISGHFANQSNTSYLDIFSCKQYDPYVVAEFTKKFFKGGEYRINVLLRK